MAETQSKAAGGQFAEAMERCRGVFAAKLRDYGASWRMMRPASLTDQMLIKALRIRTLETAGGAMVDETPEEGYAALVNYGIIALIQMEEGYADRPDMDPARAMELYSKWAAEATALMERKNHDYGGAWRMMRTQSYTDIILTKLHRIKEIEDSGGRTEVSEGVESNYMDIVNYAVFGLVKLSGADG